MYPWFKATHIYLICQICALLFKKNYTNNININFPHPENVSLFSVLVSGNFFFFSRTVPARWQLQLSTVLLGEYSYGAVSMSCLPSHPGWTHFLTGVILFYKTIWLFIKSYLDKNSLTKCERFLAWLTNQPPWIEQIEKSL